MLHTLELISPGRSHTLHGIVIGRTIKLQIIAALLAASMNLMAAQTNARLNALFDRLQTTSSVAEAATVTNLIWAIWHQSDNEQANELMQQGLAEMSQRNYRAAVETFSAMIGVDPEFAEAWNKRATVHYLLGDYKASVKDIDRTLELEPRHFGALSGLGLIMIALDNDEAAIQAFEATLAVNPFAEGARENIQRLKERQTKPTL
jgi:tetratricopeptide (TPR) repeat protein